jgi:hypothetical protein
MKRTLGAVLALAVLAVLVFLTPLSKHLVPAVHAQSGCTNATLTGNYGFTFNGFTRPSKTHGASTPFAGAGVMTLDGAGNASAKFSYSYDGMIGYSPYTATYTVNPNCTGAMTSTDGNANMSFVIVSGGAEVFSNNISPGGTWTLDSKKQ